MTTQSGQGSGPRKTQSMPLLTPAGGDLKDEQIWQCGGPREALRLGRVCSQKSWERKTSPTELKKIAASQAGRFWLQARHMLGDSVSWRDTDTLTQDSLGTQV